MSTPPVGFPMGVEVPAKDVARGSAFYKAVFNWNFSASHLGAPEHKLLVFTVPEASVPFEGIMRLVDEISTGTKIYLYVESMANAIQDVEKNGGKKTSDVMSDGRKAFFQYFDDTEGNNFAIYSYAK